MILGDAFTDFVWGVAVLGMLVGAYFLPTIVAKARGVTSFGSIVVVNVFLGWTFIGWVVALAMAFRSVSPKEASSALATSAGISRSCPSCSRTIDPELSVCPHCSAEFAPWVSHDGVWWIQSESGAWQWLDEPARTWRRYENGTPDGSAATTRLTPTGETDPAVVAPPGLSPEAEGQDSHALADEFERLADLHERGILSDDEFQHAKQRVLAAS